MKVLIVNTSERAGGAAVAASRLTSALNRHGIKAKMLVRDKSTDLVTTLQMHHSRWLRWAFLWERLCIFAANRFRRDGIWRVDIANAGAEITQSEAFQEADIIHLHWVNQGFLSLGEIERILQSGKRVVWTMHDMWPCTAICHHARSCERFHTHCHDCPMLAGSTERDLSYRVFEQKQRIYRLGKMAFVGCSRWIANEARKSALLKDCLITDIPNTFPASLFHPASQEEARRRLHLPVGGHLLLFACQKVTNVQKGLHLLFEALKQMHDDDLQLVVVGQLSDAIATAIPQPVHTLGYVHDEATMATLYQAVDCFVTPSLEENLPNTIMEAMACGTPCVGFRVGGIPEMIDHKENGYVAEYQSIDDLVAGIGYVLHDEYHSQLSQAAAKKALKAWGEEHVASQYIKLYEEFQ